MHSGGSSFAFFILVNSTGSRLTSWIMSVSYRVKPILSILMDPIDVLASEKDGEEIMSLEKQRWIRDERRTQQSHERAGMFVSHSVHLPANDEPETYSSIFAPDNFIKNLSRIEGSSNVEENTLLGCGEDKG